MLLMGIMQLTIYMVDLGVKEAPNHYIRYLYQVLLLQTF